MPLYCDNIPTPSNMLTAIFYHQPEPDIGQPHGAIIPLKWTRITIHHGVKYACSGSKVWKLSKKYCLERATVLRPPTPQKVIDCNITNSSFNWTDWNVVFHRHELLLILISVAGGLLGYIALLCLGFTWSCTCFLDHPDGTLFLY